MLQIACNPTRAHASSARRPQEAEYEAPQVRPSWGMSPHRHPAAPYRANRGPTPVGADAPWRTCGRGRGEETAGGAGGARQRAGQGCDWHHRRRAENRRGRRRGQVRVVSDSDSVEGGKLADPPQQIGGKRNKRPHNTTPSITKPRTSWF